MSEKRPLWTTILLLLLAGAGLWGASRLPFAMLCFAGVAAVVALNGWPRRLVGVLLAAAAVPAGLSGGWLAVAGAVLMLAAGVLLVVRGHRMPKVGMGGQTPRVTDPDKEMWNALERGDDPTNTKE